MSKYISQKFLKEAYGLFSDETINKMTADAAKQGYSRGQSDGTYGGLVAGGAIGTVAGGAAVAGGVAAYQIIKSIYNKYKWKKNGCNQIQDLPKKHQCIAYMKQLELKELQASIRKCKDAKCQQGVQKRIQEILGSN